MTAAAPRADEGAERPKPHLLHGVFDSDGLTRFRLECPYEVKGVLPTGRRCWSLDDDGEIDSLQCFAKGWVDERGAELISFEITDPSFPIEVDVELHGLLQTPNLTLHVRSASSGDGGAPTGLRGVGCPECGTQIPMPDIAERVDLWRKRHPAPSPVSEEGPAEAEVKRLRAGIEAELRRIDELHEITPAPELWQQGVRAARRAATVQLLHLLGATPEQGEGPGK